jgi:hypothetical protein
VRGKVYKTQNNFDYNLNLAASYLFKIRNTSWWQHTVVAILTACKPKLEQLSKTVPAKQFFLAHFQSSCEKLVLT